MLLTTYLTCGIAYCLVHLYRLLENKEKFLISFREQYDEQVKPEYFVGLLMISCTVFWPFMMLGELKNDKEGPK